MNEELKPCPFCNGPAHLVIGDEFCHIRCHQCGATGAPADAIRESDAILAWNRRPDTPASGEREGEIQKEKANETAETVIRMELQGSQQRIVSARPELVADHGAAVPQGVSLCADRGEAVTPSSGLVERLRKLETEAVAAPWFAGGLDGDEDMQVVTIGPFDVSEKPDPNHYEDTIAEVWNNPNHGDGETALANAQLIVVLRNSLPELLALIEQQAAEIRRLTAERDEAKMEVIAWRGLESGQRKNLAASEARVKELRGVLSEAMPVMVRAFSRIHGLPRTSDTELATALEKAVGRARAAIRKAAE